MFSFGIRAATLFSRRKVVAGGKAFFIGGHSGVSGGNGITAVETLDFGTEARTSGTSMPANQGAHMAGAVGNKTAGVIAGGVDSYGTVSRLTQRHTYATNTWANSGFLETARSRFGSMSGVDHGLIAGGTAVGSGTALATTIKHTYDTTTWVAGNNLGMDVGCDKPIGGSNGTVGIVAGGSTANGSTRAINWYTFASGTYVTNTTGLLVTRHYAAGVSSPTLMHIAGGIAGGAHTESTERISFADRTTVAGNILGGGKRYLAEGASNSEKGFLAGGSDPIQGTFLTRVEKVNFATHANTPATSLATARYMLQGLSSAPVGF